MLLYLLVSTLALTLALFVYSRNIYARLHRYYLLFTVYVVLWISGSVLEKTPTAILELHFRLLFVFVSFVGLYLFMFISELAQKKWPRFVRIVMVFSAIFISALSLFTTLITREIYIDGQGMVHAVQGVLYVPAAAWVSSTGLIGVPILLAALKSDLVDKQRKQQIRVVMVSLFFSATLAILTGFLLPYATGDLSYYDYTPFALLIFSFGFAYAILKLRLFNLKAVAARGVAYFLAIMGLVVTYSLLANVLAPLFTGNEIKLSGAQFVSSIITTVILVLFYPTTKRTFDHITNNIFFRDAYDPEQFLDRLNKVLVRTIDIDVLLTNSCELMETFMKIEHVSFFVRDTSYYNTRYIGSDQITLSEEDLRALDEILPKTRKKIIYVDQFERVADSFEARAQDILRKNNIEVLVRVVSTLEYEVSGIGYLLLSQKLSGNMYDRQDFRVLDIVSNELEIAAQNALRFEEIQQFNITLQDRIEEATKELKRSNAKLKELDEAKDEFVSVASHQLRTPLTAVKGYISMLLDGDAGTPSEDQKKMLTQALLSSQRMVHLISDLLNVSRIKTKKFTIEQRASYLPEVVSSELKQLIDTAKAKKLKVHYDKPKRFPTLNVDEVKLRQVIMNFIDNAIYYTPESGHITIELKNSRFFIEFTVTDDGIGVPEDDKKKLFTKFYRAGNARKARPDGTGLGLFMAQKVVQAQGGSIVFHSQEGKGSTFGFRLSKSKIEVVSN